MIKQAVLASIAQLALLSVATAAPSVWTCTSGAPNGAVRALTVDMQAATVDGASADVAGGRITLRAKIGSEMVWLMLDTSTGVYAVDGTERGSIDHGKCVSSAPVAEGQRPATDNRANELEAAYVTLLAQARAGKLKYLQAARMYREQFRKVYPEHASNVHMNEYLAFMAMIAEKIDNKKMSEGEAEYELARKATEIHERVLAQQTQSNEAQETATRQATAEAAGAEQARLERERLELQRQVAARQLDQQDRQIAEAEARRRAEASAAMMQAGMQLLFPQRRSVQQCTGRWFAGNYVQQCI